ncbi:hypothetical protein BJY01DRAFT_117222 [Aspergillus pseudoustus]|uniref:Nephrocystin 3-like N-terminal domain-containing protein n=1 Tax=Aspergillus pseudoustus TaxID=1810923 RepID=A0ABR4KGY7_9EURO
MSKRDDNQIPSIETKTSSDLSLEEAAKLHKWLRPTDYLGEFSEFQKHLNSHVPGTGEWIRQTEQYKQWHEDTEAGAHGNGALWVKAIAGAGKSVVAARVVSHLQATERGAPVLFFFFR